MAADSSCGDWEPFSDEKCFKVFDKVGLQTHDEAERICREDESNLLRIHSLEEQKFLNEFIFNKSKIVDNVWIGAKFIDQKFRWEDYSEMSFTNWAAGSPKNRTDYCTQMHSDPESIGKWVDELCMKKYAVACQKMQNISLSRLHEIVLELKKNLIVLDNTKNFLPIGFIYVQLPKEKSPTEIWPLMTWNDVSSTYEGVFFRVIGGGAASFGQVQEDNAPRITEVDTLDKSLIADQSQWNWNNKSIPKEGVSQWSITGSSAGVGIRFHSLGGEVRPRNMAIRIWKRIG
jgi:hypothetical protein